MASAESGRSGRVGGALARRLELSLFVFVPLDSWCRKCRFLRLENNLRELRGLPIVSLRSQRLLVSGDSSATASRIPFFLTSLASAPPSMHTDSSLPILLDLVRRGRSLMPADSNKSNNRDRNDVARDGVRRRHGRQRSERDTLDHKVVATSNQKAPKMSQATPIFFSHQPFSCKSDDHHGGRSGRALWRL